MNARKKAKAYKAYIEQLETENALLRGDERYRTRHIESSMFFDDLSPKSVQAKALRAKLMIRISAKISENIHFRPFEEDGQKGITADVYIVEPARRRDDRV